MRRLFPELGEPPGRLGVVSWRPARGGFEAVDVACCGFGLAAAGAGAAALLATRSDSACLVGLAGTFDGALLPPGSAVVADRVGIAGLGLPREPRSMGGIASELSGDPSLQPPPDPWLPPGMDRLARMGGMLSVAIPSVDRDEAALRATANRGCLAEEMEAHAVLHAAGLLGRRLVVVRGISNVAGDRDTSAWRLDEAFAAIRTVLDKWLDGEDNR